MTSQPNTPTISQPHPNLPVVKDIHIQANELIKEAVTDFENKLRLQANALAQDDDIVVSSHVREALVIMRRGKNKKWTEELPILVGGTLLGTFLQGFVNELSLSILRPPWIATYVILGIIGISLIYIGFLKQNQK